MALAYLRANDVTPEGYHFVADTGSNDFYAYNIGRASDHAGLPWGDGALDEVVHRSPLQRRGPTTHPFDRSFRFTIPTDLFSRDARHVQLVSYRDQARHGPAASRIVSVVPPQRVAADREFPESLWRLREGGDMTPSVPAFRPARRTEFTFQESPISRAMFVDGILDALRLLAPALLDRIPSVLGQAENRSGISLDTLVSLLRQFISITSGGGEATINKPENSATHDAENAITNNAGSSATIQPTESSPAASIASLRHRVDGFSRFSRQQTAEGGLLSGPLLAGLMGPLMQQAPQLLQVLANRPLDFLTTLIHSGAQQDLQREQQQQAFVSGLLREINRNMLMDQIVARLTNPQALAPLLARASSIGHRSLPVLGRSFSSSTLPRESKRVRLQFDVGPMIDINGKAKSVYQPSNGVTLSTRLNAVATPPTSLLPKAIVEVEICDLVKHAPVLRKSFKLQNVRPAEPIPLDFTAMELSGVPRHHDLRVCATMRWPTVNGTVGARAEHAICLTDGTLFDRPASAASTERSLADVNTYRAFWNKVWEGGVPPGSESKRWKFDVVCRYYLTANPVERSNARIDTRIAAAEVDGGTRSAHVSGRMKAGMELSFDELNKLRPAFDIGPPLPEEMLVALKESEVRNRFDLEATTRLRLSGNATAFGAVWVYPAVTLRDVVLLRVTATNDAGQVIATEQEHVSFPFPTSLHFLSLRST